MILPLCTHEGSGLGSSEETIAFICPDAQLFEGLAVCAPVATKKGTQYTFLHTQEKINDWLKEIGY